MTQSCLQGAWSKALDGQCWSPRLIEEETEAESHDGVVGLGFKHSSSTLALYLHTPAFPQTRVTYVIGFNRKDQQNKQNRNSSNQQTLQQATLLGLEGSFVLLLSALLGSGLGQCKSLGARAVFFSPHPHQKGHMHFLGAGTVLKIQA